mmetsp:Transcript_43656/g.100736  ORF Transcript_43656/g.100736 Transcript_43656/m.100736 type:complete len:190 (-) Transcript_43656:104-673(-)
MASAGDAAFTFPEYYHLPPFFTIQPNQSVRVKQLEMWTSLICDYCKFHHIFWLDIANAGTQAPFSNTSIERALTSEGVRLVANHLVNARCAAWIAEGGESGDRSRLLLYWLQPEQWADALLQWVERTGRINKVETIARVLEDCSREDPGTFKDVPREIIMPALEELERRKRAAVFKGTSSQEGVKFLPP